MEAIFFENSNLTLNKPRVAVATNAHEAHVRILTLNAGSSSLKWALYDGEDRLVGGTVNRMANDPADHVETLDRILTTLGQGQLGGLVAVGHRVVHGGPNNLHPCPITPALLTDLHPLASLDPDHMPAALAIIDDVAQRLPGLLQVACFDTSFFAKLPRIARVVAIPRHYEKTGIRRFGFHGLSYTFLMQELARVDPTAARGRVILAHLGSGASLAAVHDGRCVDTTMGYTPASGLVMATRSGDLDPGLMIRLLRMGLSVDALDDMVNHQSGLLGVSGTSSDMQDLLAAESSDAQAAEAVALFCYQAAKSVGALATTLGGLETLVFSGGIGENSPQIRLRIAERLAHLDIEVDIAKNDSGSPVISTESSGCTVRVAHTDEGSVIAAQTITVCERGNPL